MASTAPLLYFLIALTGGHAPVLSTLGTFKDADACKVAASSLTSALSGASDGAQVGCFPMDALIALDDARLK